ncbi:3-hydroxybutyryl-CoA dehydrogenase [Candidatus Poriferisocius sp.]|uniref:3-hydroxybutyryl-CoA dehydrogenase n=1 Tax=Candidatus Poriferisocius sp. TaxID=3101276 RepID=UPI003B022857
MSTATDSSSGQPPQEFDSPLEPITRVGVIGGGTMGSGIAEVCARAGLDTLIIEIDDAAIDDSRKKIKASLNKAVARNKLHATARDLALDSLSYSSDLGDLGDRDLVIEAIIESLEEKLSVFRAMDKVMKPNSILATNTSSIPIITLGSITSRSDMVIGMHFFNPAPVQPLVELVRSLNTTSETMDRADRFVVEVLGKRVIRCRDRAGFVVNRLLVPYLLDAIRMFDEGKVSAADIDSGMMYGCGHPMGPLTLCDLIGLDTIEAVADVLYEEFKGTHNAPPPLLRRMVAAGHLGRKSGKGFYEYDG